MSVTAGVPDFFYPYQNTWGFIFGVCGVVVVCCFVC